MKGKSTKATKAKDTEAENTTATVVMCLRVSAFQKRHLEELATVAGLSRSEYLRRRFFGGKPIIAHTDLCTIRELRRLGGLLKYNFEAMRQGNASKHLFDEHEKLLKHVYAVIDRIGKSS